VARKYLGGEISVRKAAAVLGMSRSTFCRRIRKEIKSPDNEMQK